MRLSTIVAGTLMAALAIPVTVATPTQAAPGALPADVQRPPAGSSGTSADDLTMQWSRTDPGSVDMTTATMTEVFTKANRKARYGKDCKVSGLKATPSVRWCFQSDDNKTPNWYPQGVTSDSDAESDGGWNGQNGVLVSWYHKPAEKGVRVTLLNTNTGKYRHLLLVVPDGKGSYGPANLHAGGIVWYGHKLFVADTYNGVRVFDLHNIWDLTADPDGNVTDKSRIGLHDGTYYAHGYRYAVPQMGRWKSPEEADRDHCTTTGPIRNSWMSLDRSGSPHRLVIGEYCGKSTEKTPGRVSAWNMASGDIAANQSGVATADGLDRLPRINGDGVGTSVQGGVTTGKGRWFFSVSRGPDAAGDVLKFQHKKGDSSWYWDLKGRKSAPQGAEDLSFRYRRSKRLLYSVSEYPNHRIIYARNTYSGW